jgi:hypothetical protein
VYVVLAGGPAPLTPPRTYQPFDGVAELLWDNLDALVRGVSMRCARTQRRISSADWGDRTNGPC